MFEPCSRTTLAILVLLVACAALPAQAQAAGEDDPDAYAEKVVLRLKRIGVALQNYHDAMKAFPPAVKVGKDRKTPHSWRVAILPFLDDGGMELYSKYKQDEPWDSEHNRKLIPEGNKFYCIDDDPKSQSCAYFVLLGPGSGFNRTEPTKIRSITDGTSRTISVVEAQRDIPWTKPEDLEVLPDKPLPKLGGHFDDGFLCLLHDASVHFIEDDTGEDVLRAMISKSGRELLSTDANDRWILQSKK